MSYCGALWEQRREIFNRVVFLYSSTRALGFQFPVRVGTVILVCYSVVIFVWRGRGGVIIWGARGPIVPYCPYCPVGWVGCLLVIVMDVGNLLWNLGKSRVSAERPFVLGSSQGCPLFVCPSRPIGRDQDLNKNTGPALGIRPNWLLGAGVIDFIEMSDVAVFPAADTTDVLAAVF